MEEEKTEVKEMVLSITLTKEGGVRVDGPIKDEMLCLWLLDKAKDTIKAFNIKVAMANQPRIAKPSILNFARKPRF